MENATWAELLPEQKIVVEFFCDGASSTAKLVSERSRDGGGRRLNGTAPLSPRTNRNLVFDYDINSALKRHFLRRQLGPQHAKINWPSKMRSGPIRGRGVPFTLLQKMDRTDQPGNGDSMAARDRKGRQQAKALGSPNGWPQEHIRALLPVRSTRSFAAELLPFGSELFLTKRASR